MRAARSAAIAVSYGGVCLKYIVKQSFNGGGRTYRIGDIIEDDVAAMWRNLQALIIAGYVDPVYDQGDINGITKPEN